jgi:RNA polymerase sigma-70 factor (ECF subfamily)
MNGVMARGSTYVGTISESRDEKGFRLAFDQNYRDILAYARRRSSPTDAEDIAAETFTIAWRKWNSAPPDALRPWLFGIARRVLANNRRSSRRQSRLAAKVTSLSEAATPPPTFGEHAELDRAMAMLRFQDREIIRLHCWEDLSIPDIAVILGCSANAASIRLHRARQQLEHALASGGQS